MDQVTALGVTCNALQLFEIAWKLVSGCQSIYRSEHGASEQSRMLEAIADDILHLSDAIVLNDDCSRPLQELGRLSKQVASEMLDIINSLKVKVKGKHRMLGSFVAALREIWHQDKISEFVELLQRLQSQATAHIQYLMMNKQSQVYNEILQLKRTAENLDIHMDRTIDGLRNAILDGSKQISAQLDVKMNEVLNSTRELTITQHHGVDEISEKLVDEILQMLVDRISEKLSDLETSITRLQSEMRGANSLQRVLQSLYFERFRARHDQIPKAHTKTFDWIFEDGGAGHHDSLPSKFLHWLERRNGIFWIRGKAGSGKSTLMKFLCTDPRTIPYLQIWAEDKKLVFGKYFFWSAGTPLQKSREGLLRSLLFDILNECPELSPHVEMKVAHRLNITTVSDEIWTLNLLQDVCSDILSWDLSAKFCLFIDGLDEYNGFSEDLIEVIQNLASCSGVKICVSSRPWTEFVDCFSDDPESLIRLEDLTFQDITTYVHDRLFKNVRFQKLAMRDPSVSKLKMEIVKKSKGVFLWVYLVVRSLLEGAKYADSIQILRKRLMSFPPDLEDFFQHMLNGVDSIYREKTAKIFKYAMAAPSPMPVLVYHFLDKIEEDPTFTLEDGQSRMRPDEVQSMLEDMENRLDGWTKGLLEVARTPKAASVAVEFLHRTVRDYIHSSAQVNQMFNEALGEDFHASREVCHGLLAFIMFRPSSPELLELTDGWPLDIFYHAKVVTDDLGTSRSVHPILDRLRYYVYGSRVRFIEDMCHLAVQFGLVDYVDAKLRTLQMEGVRKEDYTQELKEWNCNDGYVQDLCTALLRSALQFPDQQNIRHNIRLQYKPRMIRYLVEKGADPNSGPENAPVWVTALDKFKTREESSGYNKHDAVEVFSILKGAVPALKLPVGDKVDKELITMFGIRGVACTTDVVGFQGEEFIIENES